MTTWEIEDRADEAGGELQTICTLKLDLAPHDSICHIEPYGELLLVHTDCDLYFVVDPLAAEPCAKFLHTQPPRTRH